MAQFLITGGLLSLISQLGQSLVPPTCQVQIGPRLKMLVTGWTYKRDAAYAEALDLVSAVNRSLLADGGRPGAVIIGAVLSFRRASV